MPILQAFVLPLVLPIVMDKIQLLLAGLLA